MHARWYWGPGVRRGPDWDLPGGPRLRAGQVSGGHAGRPRAGGAPPRACFGHARCPQVRTCAHTVLQARFRRPRPTGAFFRDHPAATDPGWAPFMIRNQHAWWGVTILPPILTWMPGCTRGPVRRPGPTGGTRWANRASPALRAPRGEVPTELQGPMTAAATLGQKRAAFPGVGAHWVPPVGPGRRGVPGGRTARPLPSGHPRGGSLPSCRTP